jgi:hypothetical protein
MWHFVVLVGIAVLSYIYLKSKKPTPTIENKNKTSTGQQPTPEQYVAQVSDMKNGEYYLLL